MHATLLYYVFTRVRVFAVRCRFSNTVHIGFSEAEKEKKSNSKDRCQAGKRKKKPSLFAVGFFFLCRSELQAVARWAIPVAPAI